MDARATKRVCRMQMTNGKDKVSGKKKQVGRVFEWQDGHMFRVLDIRKGDNMPLTWRPIADEHGVILPVVVVDLVLP